MSPMEAEQAEDEFMLTRGHMSLWYDVWYQRRGGAIIEAKDKAHRESEAKIRIVRSRTPEAPPPASVASNPISLAKSHSSTPPSLPTHHRDADVARQARIRKKRAANHAHAKARL
jgi:hypothetical protein